MTFSAFSKKQTKILIILITAVVAGLIYLLSIFFAYPIFQNTRLTDPLAAINSLSPLFYLAIALTALLGVGCFIWRIENRYLHILLLLMLAVMLWLTPYLLAGFVRLPDSPWHVGVAMKMPEVLDGQPVAFSDYAWSFPGAFIYHYSLASVAGIQPLTYITLFPLLALTLFVLLCYLLLTKLFSPQTALLSMLMAIPGLHYLQLHASPHVIGVLLMLTALLWLVSRGTVAKVIAIMVIIATIVSHPTTPLVLYIFLAAALLTSLIYAGKISRTQVALASIVIIGFFGWFSWYFLYPDQSLTYPASPPAPEISPGGPLIGEPSPASPGITAPRDEGPLIGEPSLGERALGGFQFIAPGGIEVAPSYLTGTPFVYGNIHNLNRGIYIFYALAAIGGILYLVTRTYFEKRSLRKLVFRLGGLYQNEVLMIVSVLLLLPFTFMLAEKAHDLIETGLTFLVLVLSCLIASVIARWQQITSKIIRSFLIVGVLFLTLSFPFVAYSIDAYSSFPESEEVGLEFLARRIPLDGKTIAMSWATQLALYLESPLNQTEFVILTRPEAPKLSRVQPDLVIFRSTGYYYVAMRYDLSFENNRFAKYLDFVNSQYYDRVYSSSAFEVYSRSEKKQ